MGKYTEDVKLLLKFIGGKENISAVSHCITRLRFVLADTSKDDVKAIEEMKLVKGSFTQAGQFQVIIGNAVSEVYNELIKLTGIEGLSKEEVKQAAKKNQNLLQRIVTVLAKIFAPLMPAIITGGLILGFRNCIDALYIFENNTKTLCDISPFWAGVDHFLWLIGEAVFHMLPVGICWSVTKKMGTTQILGIILGLTLVSGQLLNAYGVAGGGEIPVWDFGFFQINRIGYQAQVIPAMLAAFMLVYLEKFFRKIVPQVVSMIIVTFMSILLSVIAAHFVLGPIGWKIGSAISAVVYAGITGPLKILFGGIFGLVYAPLVITGLHHTSNAIDMQLISDYGGTMLWPMIALSNIAQGSTVLGMIYLQKRNTKAQEVNVPACISCYLGVTEPAMFGVNLKHSFPFLAGMIGSALASIVCVMTSTTANAIGIGGIPGILSIQAGYIPSFAICMLIAIAVPFTLTLSVGLRKLSKEDRGRDSLEKKEETKISTQDKALKAFVSGSVIPLKEVKDGVFSEEIMGEGLAILPESEVLYAPADAEVVTTMSTSQHVCGLKLSNGMEILIHVGIDTVRMKGLGFTCLVNEGQKVKEGEALIYFEKEKIQEAGYSDAVVMVITDKGEADEISFVKGISAKEKETVIAYFK